MASSGFSEKFVYFLAGGCIGAAVALLFAPKTGEETRELLGSRAKQSAEELERRVSAGRERLQEKKEDVTSAINETIEKGRETITRQKEQLSQAVESGKKAYQSQKSKLQDS